MDDYKLMELLAEAFVDGKTEELSAFMATDCIYISEYANIEKVSSDAIIAWMNKVFSNLTDADKYGYKIIKLEDVLNDQTDVEKKDGCYQNKYAMLLYQLSNDYPATVVSVMQDNETGKIKKIVLSRSTVLYNINFRTMERMKDSESDTPFTVKAISRKDLQKKEFLGVLSGQHFENRPVKIEGDVYIWIKADEFMQKYLAEKGYSLVKSEIFEDCIGYHCFRNEKFYVVYMFAYGQKKTTQLDGDYCDKFLYKPFFNNGVTPLVVYLNVKRCKEGNEVKYHVCNYCGDKDAEPDFWKVSVINGKTVLLYFPGEEEIDYMYKFMYAFNHDSLDVYDCILCELNPAILPINSKGWFLNSALYDCLHTLHEEHGNIKLGYVRFNDVIYSMVPYLEGYGFLAFRFDNSINRIAQVEAFPFEGKEAKVAEFIKTEYRESATLFSKYPKLKTVTALPPVATERFALKLDFDNGECRKYVLPLKREEGDGEVIEYCKHVFTDRIWVSAQLGSEREPEYKGYCKRLPCVEFKNKYFISCYSCYENSIPYSVPTIVDEIVYEDDNYKIKRIWKWNVNAIYEDSETGLIKVLLSGSAFNYYGVSTFVTVDGKRACSLDFDYISDFSSGRSRVSTYGCGYGYLDKDMNFVTPLKYAYASDFNNGKAKVDTGEDWYFIDTNGNEIKIESARGEKYEEVGDYHEGLCRVSTLKLRQFDLSYHSDYGDIAGIWGFVNEEGKVVIEPQYIYANDFEDGLAIVCKGKWTIDKKWDNEYNTGRYWTEVEKWGAIDLTGKEVIPFVFDEIKNFNDTREAFIVHYGGWKEGHWGVIDNRGNWLAEPVFEDIDYEYQDGLFAFYQEDKWSDDNVPLGIYDVKQKKVIFEPQFTDVTFYEDGWICVEVYDKKLGRTIDKLIDRTGKEKFPSVYTHIFARDDYYEVIIKDENGRSKGIIDKNGNIILPCSKELDVDNFFNSGIYYRQRRFIFEDNEKKGMKDFDGNVIIPAKYRNIYGIEDPFLCVVLDNDEENNVGLITHDDREVVVPVYERIMWTKDKTHILCKGPDGCEMLQVIYKCQEG